MWRAVAFANGSWREIEVFARDDVVPSPTATLGLARQAIAAPYQGLLQHFEHEVALSQRPYIGREAIELWADAAAVENKEFNPNFPGSLEARDGALALRWNDKLPSGAEPLNPITVAWHDRSFVMLPLAGDEERVLIEYVPSDSEAKRADYYRDIFGARQHALETILEWRGYFGRECAIIENWQAMRGCGHGFIASIRGTTGYVGGWVVRRLIGHRGPLPMKDPTRESRLANMYRKYPDVAAAVPDIAKVEDPTDEADSAVVFIHGTLSCGLQGLKDLYPPESLNSWEKPRHVYRYEHDTFVSPLDNARELTDLIGQRLKAGRLLLAAHSRGGLVARLTKIFLAQAGYSNVTVYTFGTPHLGTPLVYMGRGVLHALLSVGENVVGAIPLNSPLVKAFSYVYSPSDLPPGIAFMDERSPGGEMLNALDQSRDLVAWGANFDLHGRSGFGFETTGFLLGSLGPGPHDLVVPTSSALGCGQQMPRLTCSHTQYFLDPGVRKAIRAFDPPKKDWLEKFAEASIKSDAVPPILQDDESVTIGWVRIPKRK